MSRARSDGDGVTVFGAHDVHCVECGAGPDQQCVGTVVGAVHPVRERTAELAQAHGAETTTVVLGGES